MLPKFRFPNRRARACLRRVAFVASVGLCACGQRSELLGTITTAAEGGAGQAGSGGAPAGGGAARYIIGADITSVQAAEDRGASFSDGTEKDIFQLLRDHGFNYVRLRTFVDPRAADGYDQQNGYADLAHTITFAQRVKAAGMGFLLDLHYSDNWADPGKQCVPIAWQHYTTIAELASVVHDYTSDVVGQLSAAGARPDLVQLGNGITPGILLHVCDSGGAPTGSNAVTGSAANWSRFASLLEAGSSAVRSVDQAIQIVLHIDQCGDKPADPPGAALAASIGFVQNALSHGVQFDILGESCYQKYQGDPNNAASTKVGWVDTLSGLGAEFPGLPLLAVEYGSMEREINDAVFGLANRQGLGGFDWEPTEQGDWNNGHELFVNAGNSNAYVATIDLSLFDAMTVAYASRL